MRETIPATPNAAARVSAQVKAVPENSGVPVGISRITLTTNHNAEVITIPILTISNLHKASSSLVVAYNSDLKELTDDRGVYHLSTPNPGQPVASCVALSAVCANSGTLLDVPSPAGSSHLLCRDE